MLQVPVVLAPRALQPKAVVTPAVQPRTIPATVGVAEGIATDAHFKPVVQVESAMRTSPLAPTSSEVGVAAALPARIAPFAV